METLSRAQEGKTSLTSVWSDIAADQLETGMGSSNNPRWIVLDSIPHCWRGRNRLCPGHLSPSMPVPPLCLQEQPFQELFPHSQGGRLCPVLHVEPSSSYVQFQVFQTGEGAGMSLTCMQIPFLKGLPLSNCLFGIFFLLFQLFFFFSTFFCLSMLDKQSFKELSKSKRWGCYTN